MRTVLWLTAAVLLARSVAPAAAPPAPVDPLKGLTAKEAKERVIAALKERDAKLANVRYVVRQRWANVDAQGGRHAWDDKVVDVRRHPKGHWMSQAHYKAGQKVPYWEQIVNIRRSGESRIVTRDLVTKKTAAGRHAGGESTTFRSFWFNEVVGFRSSGDGPPRTVAEWVGDPARTPPRGVTCTTGIINDRPAVSVAVSEGPQEKKTLWLDPSRDWMIVRIDYFSGTPAHYNWLAIEVEEAEMVDGLWVPLRALCRSGITPSKGLFTEIRYTVESVTLGKVTEADLAVAPGD